MTGPKDFKVIIVGAGISGLALANLLEEFDIDYLVLESHKAVASTAGAYITLAPNGLRIMDQIGCYDALRALPEDYIVLTHLRDKEGRSVASVRNVQTHFEKRHGLPMINVERHSLLKVFFDNLKHKERILLSKRIANIVMTQDGVEVTATDGTKHVGSIVVGADGVRSKVREEMFRIGNENNPTTFDMDEPNKAPFQYASSFGIAQNVPGWKSGEQHIVHGINRSAVVIAGAQNCINWTITARLPEKKYGRDIPRYTEEDEMEVVAISNPSLDTIVWRWLVLLVGASPLVDALSALMVGGSRVSGLEVPNRPHAIPFDDELPARPLSSAYAYIPQVLMAGCMILALRASFSSQPIPATLVSVPNRISHSHTSSVDLVMQAVLPALIYTIEGHRAGNGRSILSLPTIFTFAMQTQGINRIAPLHAVLMVLTFGERPIDRPVLPTVAKSLVPAFVLGYAVPTIMVLTFAPDATSEPEFWATVWQCRPVLFSAFITLCSLFLAARSGEPVASTATRADLSARPFKCYENQDAFILRSIYKCVFLMESAARAFRFVDRVSSSGLFASPMSMDQLIHHARTALGAPGFDIMAGSTAPATSSIFLLNLYCVWSLRARGYVTTHTVMKAAAYVVLGQLLLGTSVTWAGLWYWREGILANLSTLESIQGQ